MRFPVKLLLSAALSLAATFATGAEMGEGKPAPGFDIVTLDGQHHTLESEKGRVVLINLWATWCVPCREEMPAIEAYYREHKGEGLVVLAVSMDEASKDAQVQSLMRQFSYPAAYKRDANLKGYGRIWRMPMSFVIDRQGVLRKDGSEGDPKVDAEILDKVVTPLLKANN